MAQLLLERDIWELCAMEVATQTATDPRFTEKPSKDCFYMFLLGEILHRGLRPVGS